MLRIQAMVMMLLVSLASQAQPVFSAGAIKFTGDSYISTLSNTETMGIGRVDTITQGDQVLWSAGDSGNYINFVFGKFTPVVSPTAPIFNYQAKGGYVDFYLNSAGTFNTATDVTTEMSNIRGGSLLLSTEANGPTVGIATPVSYSANGFLDVKGGLFNWLLDTNSRNTFDKAVLADLSFGLTGSNNDSSLVSKDYAYIASSDLQGSASVSQVPLPAAAWAMLMGIMSMSFMAKRKTK